LELSKKLQEFPRKKYTFKVNDLIAEIVQRHDANSFILLNHIEILFDKALKIKPLSVLKKISRTKKIIVIWPGKYEYNKLTYAVPEHKEYFEEIKPDVKIIKIEYYGEGMDYCEIQKIN
jgi:hypothetical protein